MDKMAFIITTILLSAVTANAWSAEVDIPNVFIAGDTAVAADVNENFTVIETAVDDNSLRLDTLEFNDAETRSDLSSLQATLAELTSRLDVLEAQPALLVDTYFATDLVFLLSNGNLIVADIEGNTTAPGVIGSGFEWHALPGLTEVAFTVEKDDTVVVFQANGGAFVGQWNAYASFQTAIRLNGAIPGQGAIQSNRVVTDDNISSGGANWHVLYTAVLPAGEHRFSVMVRVVGAGNEASFTMDGRSGTGYDGRIKTTVMQVN